MKAGNDIVFNNYSIGNIIVVDEGPDFDEGGKLQMVAGHDITFNQSDSDPQLASSLSLLSLDDYSDTTITAGNDINFNRYKYNPFIDLYRYAKASSRRREILIFVSRPPVPPAPSMQRRCKIILI